MLITLLTPCLTSAITVKTANDGTGLMEKRVIVENDIQFGPGVRQHGDAWRVAYDNPGSIVPIKVHLDYVRDGPFHIVVKEVSDVGIRYFKGSIDLVHDQILSSKRSIDPCMVLWLFAVALGICGVLLEERFEQAQLFFSFCALFTIAGTLFSLVLNSVSTTSLTFTGIVILVSGVIASGFAYHIFVLFSKNEKPYRSVRAYGIFMAIIGLAALFS